MIPIKACGKRLIVSQVEEKHEPGKLILTVEKDTFLGVVIAKGDDVSESIRIYDLVVLRRMSGIPFEVEGAKLLSVIEQEVMAVIEGKEAE